MLSTPEFQEAARGLSDCVRFLAAAGLMPATSSNVSCRVAGREVVAVSRSGVDKSAFGPEDVMAVDLLGAALAPAGARPSAETALHAAVYAARPDVRAVLHTHSVAATVLSLRHAALPELSFEGFEIAKGLAGVTTHETHVALPILPNSQDMAWLAGEVAGVLGERPDAWGLLIVGHGLYAWGGNLREARRHVETFEFLMRCRLEMERAP